MNLLSIDWDYFFPLPKPDDHTYNLFDWQSNEAPFFINGIWGSRAMGFLLNGLPLPDTTGKEDDFWERFKLKLRRTGTLYYCESHSRAASKRVTRGMGRPWDAVWNYDAHHDMGYAGSEKRIEAQVERGRWECDYWAVWHHLTGADVHVRYPAWRVQAGYEDGSPLYPADIQIDHGETPDVLFDRVFICRSGAWVPPWLDAKFEKFVQACPVKRKVNLDGIAPREFDVEEARQEAANLRQMLTTASA